MTHGTTVYAVNEIFQRDTLGMMAFIPQGRIGAISEVTKIYDPNTKKVTVDRYIVQFPEATVSLLGTQIDIIRDIA